MFKKNVVAVRLLYAMYRAVHTQIDEKILMHIFYNIKIFLIVCETTFVVVVIFPLHQMMFIYYQLKLTGGLAITQ